MARLTASLLLLLLLPGISSAQICSGYAIPAGDYMSGAGTYDISTSRSISGSLALQSSGGVSSLTGVHQSRASTSLVYQLPVKRISACLFAGVEHRYTWFDGESGMPLSAAGSFSAADWYLPVGLTLAYYHPIKPDVGVFAYAQPYYIIGRSLGGNALGLLRSGADYGLPKGNFALRSGVGLHAGPLLVRLDNHFNSAPSGSSAALRLNYRAGKTATAPIPR